MAFLITKIAIKNATKKSAEFGWLLIPKSVYCAHIKKSRNVLKHCGTVENILKSEYYFTITLDT